MDKLVLALKGKVLLPLVLVPALALWLFLCKAHYESYWDGTILRVQTVDFNILHHTLPTTLSTLIVAGRADLIQRVLDSSYGIFGLVVTDPEGRSVLYKTGKVYHRASWQQLVSPEFLARTTEPYDLLTDPPPLEPVFAHSSPRSAAASRLAELPAGRVLGRVYYVRQPPPSLARDLSTFFGTGWLELSGSKRGYLLITLATVGFGLALVFLILFRQRSLEVRRRELEHLACELDIRQKALDHLACELSGQKERKRWLEQEADQSYRRALSLRSALATLKETLARADLAGQEQTVPEAAGIKLRPPIHPPSELLAELEALIPELATDAQGLRAQAEQLQEHCRLLEERQAEMKRILDQAYLRASELPGNLLPFRTSSPGHD